MALKERAILIPKLSTYIALKCISWLKIGKLLYMLYDHSMMSSNITFMIKIRKGKVISKSKDKLFDSILTTHLNIDDIYYSLLILSNPVKH